MYDNILTCFSRLINCDFFNKKLVGIKKSTAIRHIGGSLSVVSCSFCGTAGSEILCDGDCKNVEPTANTSTGKGENEGSAVLFTMTERIWRKRKWLQQLLYCKKGVVCI